MLYFNLCALVNVWIRRSFIIGILYFILSMYRNVKLKDQASVLGICRYEVCLVHIKEQVDEKGSRVSTHMNAMPDCLFKNTSTRQNKYVVNQNVDEANVKQVNTTAILILQFWQTNILHFYFYPNWTLSIMPCSLWRNTLFYFVSQELQWYCTLKY